MKRCLSPFYPDESAKDVRAGKIVYPDKDERLGLENEPPWFPCFRCSVCTDTRRRRWVGRCLAEQTTAVKATFVTATYGDDRYCARTGIEGRHPHADELVVSDGQKWLKRIRSAGYPCSYLWVFERGTLKGRVHLHACLFWHGKVPKFREGAGEAGRNWEDQFWHDGLVHYEDLNEANIAYVCDYILPEPGDGIEDRSFRKSTKPPLGYRYFENRARTFVEQGLAPQDSVYTFPGVTIDYGRLAGQPKHFTFSDVVRDRFLRSFVRQWRELRPGERMPESEYLQAHLDRSARHDRSEIMRHDDSAWRNLRDNGSYYGRQEGIALPGRFRERS